mmetsp:Transcript_46321/g.94727  ORF Transcript_46321/g.94727 Transcript_46321/m.94727 type:complete len:221 (+) Transcript_46321:2166-2828(+)
MCIHTRLVIVHKAPCNFFAETGVGWLYPIVSTACDAVDHMPNVLDTFRLRATAALHIRFDCICAVLIRDQVVDEDNLYPPTAVWSGCKSRQMLGPVASRSCVCETLVHQLLCLRVGHVPNKLSTTLSGCPNIVIQAQVQPVVRVIGIRWVVQPPSAVEAHHRPRAILGRAGIRLETSHLQQIKQRFDSFLKRLDQYVIAPLTGFRPCFSKSGFVEVGGMR